MILENMRDILNYVYGTSKKVGLKFNMKTNVMHIGGNEDPNIPINNTKLENAKKLKYLKSIETSKANYTQW